MCVCLCVYVWEVRGERVDTEDYTCTLSTVNSIGITEYMSNCNFH